MLGKNPLRKLEVSDGSKLMVQGKPWRTIQGEGPYAGVPATFIRLWGCHLHCTFCDTDFESDAKEPNIFELVRQCEGCELVVLTGGEPLRQNIMRLCQLLANQGHKVQVETAGTFAPQDDLYFSGFPEFVVSPKTPVVCEYIKGQAIAWKYIVSNARQDTDTDGLPIVNTQFDDGKRLPLAKPPVWIKPSSIYLQPMDEGDAATNLTNTQLCVQLALKHGYRVSLQQHKILGVP